MKFFHRNGVLKLLMGIKQFAVVLGVLLSKGMCLEEVWLKTGRLNCIINKKWTVVFGGIKVASFFFSMHIHCFTYTCFFSFNASVSKLRTAFHNFIQLIFFLSFSRFFHFILFQWKNTFLLLLPISDFSTKNNYSYH